MNNIPYEEWSQYLISLLKERGVNDGLVLDLGCGTGSLTELLAASGYDMIGLDNYNKHAGNRYGKEVGKRQGHPLSSSGYAGI